MYDARNSRSALRQRNDELVKLLADKTDATEVAPESSTSASSPSSTGESLDRNRSKRGPQIGEEGGLVENSYTASTHESTRNSWTGENDWEPDLVVFLTTLAAGTFDTSARNLIQSFLQLKNRKHSQRHGRNIELYTTDMDGDKSAGIFSRAIPPAQDMVMYHREPNYIAVDHSPLPTIPTTVNPINISAAGITSEAGDGSVPHNSMSSAVLEDFHPTTLDIRSSSRMSVKRRCPNETYHHNFDHILTPTFPETTNSTEGYQHPMNGFMPFDGSIKANHFPTHIQEMQQLNLTVAPYAVEPLWKTTESLPPGPARWASETFTEIRRKARWMIQHGTSIEAVIGPTSLDNLLSPEVFDPNKALNVSDWAQAFCSNFPHLVSRNVPAPTYPCPDSCYDSRHHIRQSLTQITALPRPRRLLGSPLPCPTLAILPLPRHLRQRTTVVSSLRRRNHSTTHADPSVSRMASPTPSFRRTGTQCRLGQCRHGQYLGLMAPFRGYDFAERWGYGRVGTDAAF